MGTILLPILGSDDSDYGGLGYGGSASTTNSNGEDVLLDWGGHTNSNSADPFFIDINFLTKTQDGHQAQTVETRRYYVSHYVFR